MKRVLVGLSGGVDSAVAAYLLQQQGFEVVGGFMINYTTDSDNCTTKEDLHEAQKVATHLGIPLHTFDFQDEYRERIIQYIVDGYHQGLTPNPDVLCNSEIKFNLFLEEGIAAGFDAVGTGHYARILYNHSTEGLISYTHSAYPLSVRSSGSAPKGHRAPHDLAGYKLFKGIDTNKDQSYFLAGLHQWQLAKAVFPLGNLTKPEIRAIAKEIGLPNADRKDSQGICFIGKVPMKQFLEHYIPVQGGDILDTRGDVIGKHTGARGYTIGQRKGLGVAAAEPLFVLAKNVEENTITVGYAHETALYAHDSIVHKWHRIDMPSPFPLLCQGKIRYRQADQEVLITENSAKDTESYHVHFTQPQRAIASGQIFVAYQGDELIGSAVIG